MARQILGGATSGAYLSWDNREDRREDGVRVLPASRFLAGLV